MQSIWAGSHVYSNREDIGTAHYVIWVYRLRPETIVPSPNQQDFLKIYVPIIDSKNAQKTIQEIPSWIRINAGWWHENRITDNDFVQGMQWLVSNGIMKINEFKQY